MKLHELNEGKIFIAAKEKYLLVCKEIKMEGYYSCVKIWNNAPMLVNINNDVEVLDDTK